MTEEPTHLILDGTRGTLCNLQGANGAQKAVMWSSYWGLRQWVERHADAVHAVVCEDCEGRLALHELAETDLEGDSDLRNGDQLIIRAGDGTGRCTTGGKFVLNSDIDLTSNKFKV